MKSIVIYYTLENSTKKAANIIATKLNADILELQPMKAYPTGSISKFFWGGKSVIFNQKPKLSTYHFNASTYDLIIIGTPIWAGTYTPPIQTFISENSLTDKKIALFSCHDGGGPKKCFQQLTSKLSSSEIIAYLDLINPNKAKAEETNQKIETFISTISLKMKES